MIIFPILQIWTVHSIRKFSVVPQKWVPINGTRLIFQIDKKSHPELKQTSQPVDIILENRKLVSNRSSTSNLDDNHHPLEEHDLHDSTKSSKRASIAELEHKNDSARSDSILTHDLDAFVEVRHILSFWRAFSKNQFNSWISDLGL